MLQSLRFGEGIAARVQPGAGEKVLWIHGYTMDSSTWAGLWHLLRGWHHIGVDLPGHGASRPLEPDEDLPTLADRLAKLALAHDVRHVVALSFGTIVALQMAIQRPGAFASLILGAPALAGGLQDRDIEARYRELARLYFQRGPGPHLRTLWMRSPPNIFKGAQARPLLWKQLSDVIDRHAWAELGNGGMYALISRPQTEADLRGIRSATLILQGEDELHVFKYLAQLLSQGLRACDVVCVPKTGHLCLLEDPHATHEPIHAHLEAHSLHSSIHKDPTWSTKAQADDRGWIMNSSS